MKLALLRWTEVMWDIKKDDPWKNDPVIFEENMGLKDINKRVATNYFVYKVYEILDEKKFLKNVVKYPEKILEYKTKDTDPSFFETYRIRL